MNDLRGFGAAAPGSAGVPSAREAMTEPDAHTLGSPAGETPALPGAHRGWYSRGYLPHFDQPGLIQMITFRLADAMPVERRRAWQQLLQVDDEVKRRARIETYLDAGHGSCHLRDPRVARVVEQALLHFDGERYRLFAWVVMPSHVHALIEPFGGNPLREIVHSWKSFTAKQADRILGRNGTFWQPDYFDRVVRNAEHVERARAYIDENPVKAGLVQRAGDWPFGSARFALE
ncbi:MAG: REP-associated tyrosine transposase [Dehalococcoidia bacterium]